VEWNGNTIPYLDSPPVIIEGKTTRLCDVEDGLIRQIELCCCESIKEIDWEDMRERENGKCGMENGKLKVEKRII
jgi:hypothetical protein